MDAACSGDARPATIACPNELGEEDPMRAKSDALAVSVVHVYEILVTNREVVMPNQLRNGATSIGATIEGAPAGMRRRDVLYENPIRHSDRAATLPQGIHGCREVRLGSL